MGQTITSGDLIKQLGGELIGDSNILINSVASLESANKNSVSFFNDSKYLGLLKNTKQRWSSLTKKVVRFIPVLV